MSDPNLKGVKRSSTRQTSAAASAKNRPPAGKSARPAPLVKRLTVDKAPARKAAKAKNAPAKPGFGEDRGHLDGGLLDTQL